MTLYESCRVDADQLAIAARTIAWNSGLDADTLENIVRKVERNARNTMFRGFLNEPSNDTDPMG